MDKPPYINTHFEAYNMNDGFTHDNIYIIPMEEPGNWFSASWGLVPDWFRGEREEFYNNRKYNTLNARDDKVYESNSYRNAIKERRCLIFCDGFFEPHHYNSESQPYFCYLNESDNYKNRSIFMFAGIYSKDNNDNYSASLITTDANLLFEKIHNKAKRMPLVLDRKYENDWINQNQSDSIIKGIMQEGFTQKTFTGHPVMNYRKKVNQEKKYTDEVIEPVEPIEAGLI
ncbi:Putative SOS response-associated peptidase YedK [Gramella sp. MAR_2010_147]|nr:SOS response-associated peptidase family protein [Gramella sp. MAR_2010_147]SDS13583.1 Putative SOS response-associated peptidase YedK [Gramella sp. MAR_2010_147]